MNIFVCGVLCLRTTKPSLAGEAVDRWHIANAASRKKWSVKRSPTTTPMIAQGWKHRKQEILGLLTSGIP